MEVRTNFVTVSVSSATAHFENRPTKNPAETCEIMTNNLQFLSNMLLIKYYSVRIFIVFDIMGRQDTLQKKKKRKTFEIGFNRILLQAPPPD